MYFNFEDEFDMSVGFLCIQDTWQNCFYINVCSNPFGLTHAYNFLLHPDQGMCLNSHLTTAIIMKKKSKVK